MNLDRYLEKVGLRYFTHLYKKVKAEHYIHIEGLPSDQVLQIIVKNITINSIIIAFLIGAITTIPAVLTEIYYQESLSTVDYYLYLSLVTIFMLVIELGVLYWLGLQAVHTLANITGHHTLKNDPTIPLSYQVENILVRSALELEDPVIHYLGVDPQKHISQKKMLLLSLLYKAKIILTSLLLKLLLRKVAARFGIRMGFAWVAIPVTAFWDAIVMHKVIKDATIRLFGYQLSLFIIKEIFTKEFLESLKEETQITAFRAVASVMVLAQRHHPNNLLLLMRLGENLQIKEEGDYDDWDTFQNALQKADEKEKHFLRSLLVIAAAFDGKISKKEREYLPLAFEKQSDFYFAKIEEIVSLLESGQLHKVAKITQDLLRLF